MGKRKVRIELIKDTCDICGQDAPDNAYKEVGWTHLQNIICYGWRRNVNHDIGISSNYLAHDSCIAKLIKQYLAPKKPNKEGNNG